MCKDTMTRSMIWSSLFLLLNFILPNLKNKNKPHKATTTIDQEPRFQNTYAKAKSSKFNHLQTAETPNPCLPPPKSTPLSHMQILSQTHKLAHNPDGIYILKSRAGPSLRRVRQLPKAPKWKGAPKF